MNQFITLATEYLTPSSTLEILSVGRLGESKPVYVYNYEGKHFRVFESLVDLIRFFELGKEPLYSFDSEADLDAFLEQLPFNAGKRPLNLKLNYMYRDGTNYKQFGWVIFSNPGFLSPRRAAEQFKEKLISGEYFVPQDWGLARLQKYAYDPEIDHEWHEFEDFEWTEEDATDEREISEFLNEIKKGYEV
ncbi:NUMOD1 domain-containing DNA-binding protein [Algoriphagus sp.]|uniref:NUMOD1 domain-containing DNA-binding protein n=1 Tax=Algoriphagus sp. TaxID=1872435 RepID=UPI0026092049|nr:NUMOD1 domain-containing DNA-binding protein [Algoriphagus sp.]